ncbi:MAG: penicillin-binding protein, partial [Mucinivorans sp.]
MSASIMRNSMLHSERGRLMRKAGATISEIERAFAQAEPMRVFTYKGDRDTTMTPRDSMLHYKSILRTGFVAMEPTTGYVLAYVGGP